MCPSDSVIEMAIRMDPGRRLTSLKPYERARVLRVLHDDPARAERLLALGVTPGATILVLQTFPGIIFHCDETELAVEPDVAKAIIVELH